LKELKILKEMP